MRDYEREPLSVKEALFIANWVMNPCPTCEGHGTLVDPVTKGDGERCPACKGRGTTTPSRPVKLSESPAPPLPTIPD